MSVTKARMVGIGLALVAAIVVVGCSKAADAPKGAGEAPTSTGEAPKSGGDGYDGYGSSKPDYGAPAPAPTNPPSQPPAVDPAPPTTPAQPPPPVAPPSNPPASPVLFEQMVTLTEFAFEPSLITVPLGATVKLTVMNHGHKTHDLSILGDLAVETDILQPGQSELLTFVASKAGTYRIACTQKGHAAEGMVAELIVK